MLEKPEVPPDIDYLAKDYNSFLRLMREHLALRVPDWQEPSEADIGNVLLELLAYAADNLSYYQDAVATEAYLGTARLRPSIKRHARLLDYTVHEGCNARAWVQIQVDQALVLPRGTPLLTRASRFAGDPVLPPGSPAYADTLAQGARVFETLHSAHLFPEHGEIPLYANAGEETILPAGVTSALLCEPGIGQALQLHAGDVLIFQEMKNPRSGVTSGADPGHRHAVRLLYTSREVHGTTPVLRVAWSEEDALPFPLAIAVRSQGGFIAGITVALGNIVLADHGRSVYYESLPEVTRSGRYRPSLLHTGLTHHVFYDHDYARSRPASAALSQDVQQAMPAISLFEHQHLGRIALAPDLAADFGSPQISDRLWRELGKAGLALSRQVEIFPVPGNGWALHDTVQKRHWLVVSKAGKLAISPLQLWRLRRDLLNIRPLADDFTVDMDDECAQLRFGFGQRGRQPAPGQSFLATYRIGRGREGNIRADTLSHVVTSDVRITGVRNPLPARGGCDPLATEDARLNAPYAFRAQERCVTEQDYATIAMRFPHVAGAVARLRWTGSWYTTLIYVQRHGQAAGQELDPAFKAALARFMQRFCLPGYRCEIRAPYVVPLHILLTVSLRPNRYRSIIHEALLQAFSNRTGGFFDPTRFTFGTTVALSQVVARAMSLAGVANVEVKRFCRARQAASSIVEQVPVGPLEIIRLDNDPRAPYHGTIQFQIEGGL